MIGAIVLATEQGLGYLAKDFYDEGVIDKVLIVYHSSRKTHAEWYKDEDRYSDANEFLDNIDTLLIFETPLEGKVVNMAKERGIKIIIMPMYECSQPAQVERADKVISPSLLDKEYYPSSTFINVPIPRSIKWKERKTAKTFVHNAGNGGLGGRNGTQELIQAMKWVKSPIKLIIRSQAEIPPIEDDRVELRIGTFDDIWSEGDVFIFPEKFNGLSLPLQEAFASGMAVMATDRFPNNTYLPNDVLIPVKGYKKERICAEFDMAVIDPEDIAKTIDLWYNKDISWLSWLGKEFGEKLSWDRLKTKYLDFIYDRQ